MVLEAVQSLCVQTMSLAGIIIVDDGSTDEESIRVLNDIERDSGLSVPVKHIEEVSHLLRTNPSMAAAMMNPCAPGLRTGISF